MACASRNHDTISSAALFTRSQKEHKASSISNQLHLKRGCVHEHLPISHNWQSNGILHCRKSKQTSFLLSSN